MIALWALGPWLAGVPASLTGRASCLRRRVVGVAVPDLLLFSQEALVLDAAVAK